MDGLIRNWKHRWRVRQARRDIAARLASPPPSRPHGLPWPLVVTLTSFPGRFATLHDTLASLLTQTVTADRTVLWLAHGEARLLPPEVVGLKNLEVRETDDLRSYKKIVPALAIWPDAALVTADDDVPYDRTWLERLVNAARAGEVTAHRAHRMAWLDRRPAPYSAWSRNISRPEAGPSIFPTGVGGVLYPPGTLAPETLDIPVFQRLAPTADDVWLWFMLRRSGAVARKIGSRARIVEWPGSQTDSLRDVNLALGANDRALRALGECYGWPV